MHRSVLRTKVREKSKLTTYISVMCILHDSMQYTAELLRETRSDQATDSNTELPIRSDFGMEATEAFSESHEPVQCHVGIGETMYDKL